MDKSKIGQRVLASSMVLGLLAAAGCAADAPATDSGTDGGPAQVKVASLAAAADIPLYVAMEKGYFEEEGIDVEMVTVKSSADIPALFASNEVQFGTAQPSATFFNAVAAGINDPVIMATNVYTDETAIPALMLRQDLADQGRDAGDLDGASIAVVGPSSSSEYFAKTAISKAGGDPGTAEFVTMGLPDMLSALSNGKIEAAWMFEPLASAAVDQEIAATATSVGEIATGFPTWLQASEKIIASDPETVQGFATATLRALDFYEQSLEDGDRAGIIEILTEYTTMSDAEDWANVELPTVKSDGKFDEAAVSGFQEFLVGNGVIDEVIPAAQYVDDAFRSKAAADLAGE